MPDKHKYESLLYLLTAFICLAARYYLLPQTGLTDYDSIRSWQIVQELGQGNFKNLFHHASPGFFLFFALFTPFLGGVTGYILLNAMFSVGAVLLLIRFMRRHLAIPVPEAFLVGLLYGLSVFAVSTGRNFATESISIFLFMLLLERYYQRLVHQDAKAFLQVVALLALSLTINYKFLLLLPVALLAELIVRDRVVTLKTLGYAVLIICIPFVVAGLVAVAVNLPFYIYTAAVFNLKNPVTPNPAQRVGYFNADFLFYFRYIWDFELPVLVPAIFLFPGVYRQELFNKPARSVNIYKYLFLISYSFLAGMHLLIKAPRGFTFIYGLLYLIFYLVLNKLIPNRWLIIFLLITGIACQIWRLEDAVYSYSKTSYPAVARYLREKNISKIATTVGLGLAPYAVEKGIAVKPIISETDLQRLKEQGYRYVLLDNYYQAANIRNFGNLEKLPVLKSWSEPTLLSPLLYLDHAEFNNLPYTRIINNQKKASREPAQLRLIRIPD